MNSNSVPTLIEFSTDLKTTILNVLLHISTDTACQEEKTEMGAKADSQVFMLSKALLMHESMTEGQTIITFLLNEDFIGMAFSSHMLKLIDNAMEVIKPLAKNKLLIARQRKRSTNVKSKIMKATRNMISRIRVDLVRTIVSIVLEVDDSISQDLKSPLRKLRKTEAFNLLFEEVKALPPNYEFKMCRERLLPVHQGEIINQSYILKGTRSFFTKLDADECILMRGFKLTEDSEAIPAVSIVNDVAYDSDYDNDHMTMLSFC